MKHAFCQNRKRYDQKEFCLWTHETEQFMPICADRCNYQYLVEAHNFWRSLLRFRDMSGHKLLKTGKRLKQGCYDFAERIDSQWNRHVKRFYLDNAADFLSMKKTLFRKWVGFITSTTYRPESNRIAERTNRQLLKNIRAILKAAGIGNIYRGEVVLHAAYLVNKTTEPTLKMKTAHESLFGYASEKWRPQTFGCRA